jgi:Polysaccharide deacetylase.
MIWRSGKEVQSVSGILDHSAGRPQQIQQELTKNIMDTLGFTIAPKPGICPMFVFIDDDGSADVYTRLKPIFESRGVPCTVAVVSGWVGKDHVGSWDGRALTKYQLLELQDMGWEIASHERTHIHMQDVTDEEVIYQEIVKSKEELLAMGLDVKNLVYPYGQENDRLVEVAKRFYKAGVTTNNLSNDEMNTVPLNPFYLPRVALGSFAPEGKNTLSHFQSVVDRAMAANSLVIFMTHIWAQTAEQDQLLADVIDYILEAGGEIVTLDQALQVFGDRFNMDGLIRVLPNNKILTDRLIVGIDGTAIIDSAERANDIEFIRQHFGRNKIIYSKFTYGNCRGMPENEPGLLTTYLETSEIGYISQTYRVYWSGDEYQRIYLNGWTTWHKPLLQLGQLDLDYNFGMVPPHSTVSAEFEYPGIHAKTHASLLNPQFDPGEGILCTSRVATDKVVVTVANVTSSPITPEGQPWRVYIYKVRN